VVPGLLGLLGAAGTGAALAPALQVLTIPIGVLGAAFLLRAWWLQLSHGIRTAWQVRSLAVLAVSTATAITLWVLRFAGVLG
jgi:hypothetical protein